MNAANQQTAVSAASPWAQKPGSQDRTPKPGNPLPDSWAVTLTKAAPAVVREHEAWRTDTLEGSRCVGASTKEADVRLFLTFVDICKSQWKEGSVAGEPGRTEWPVPSCSSARGLDVESLSLTACGLPCRLPSDSSHGCIQVGTVVSDSQSPSRVSVPAPFS